MRVECFDFVLRPVSVLETASRFVTWVDVQFVAWSCLASRSRSHIESFPRGRLSSDRFVCLPSSLFRFRVSAFGSGAPGNFVA